jgi:hypothetical protein
MLRVRPRDGVFLRHPETRAPVPPEGILIPSDDPNMSYWLRRQTDGDALINPDEGEE